MNVMTTEQPAKARDIVSLVEATPVIVLTDKEKFSQFYSAMKAECDAHTPDLTTEKGRKEIASLAYKVARTKTAIDDAGKKLNEEARARINAVDESRREIRAQLDALKDDVRRPLTEWEEAEKARADQCDQTLVLLRESALVGYEETAADVRKRIAHIESLKFDPVEFAGYAEQAHALRSSTLETLTTVADRMDREEAERAELDRLRAEAAERERQEERRRAEEAEVERKAAAEKAEQERIESLQREAEERAKAEAERKAQEDREAAEKAHADALAAERRRAEEAEAAAQAERDRAAREEAERKAVAEREAAEQRAREADRAHRGRVMGAAKEAIMEAGPVDETVAKSIILAIAAGNVPAVSIAF